MFTAIRVHADAPAPSTIDPAELATLARVRTAAMNSDWSWNRLEDLTDEIGPTPLGLTGAGCRRVTRVAAAVRALGAHVALQPAKVPHWVRGEERAQLTEYPGRPERTTKKGGRPWKEARAVVDGVLWVLRTGAPWADLPGRYPPYQTCHRRFQTWVEDKTLERILRKLAEDLRDRGKLDLTEAYIDGSHAGAKRGALLLESLAAARRPRSWQWQTALAFLSPSGLKVVHDMSKSSS